MINLDRYIKTWKLRREGKTYKQVGLIMGVSGEWVRTMVKVIDYKRKRNGKKSWKIVELDTFNRNGKNNGS